MHLSQLARTALVATALWLVAAPGAEAQEMGIPADLMGLRFRVERLDDGVWKPVDIGKTFKKDNTIRFRFMANTAGTLYVLNTSHENGSPEPVFEGSGAGLRRYLGLGTHIDANQVGLFPDPAHGGGMRFTGTKGRERFLFAFVPDELDATRSMMAIVPGAEGWDFEHKTSHLVLAKPGQLLFHYFEMKSK